MFSAAILRSLLVVVPILSCIPKLSISQEQRDTSRGSAIRDAIRQFDGGDSPYKVWLQQDVVWIISDEERKSFKLLQNDAERDQFIEAFWQRRNPTPDSFDNSYKDEHYRRIVYSNEHFGTRIPGWKNDRGRIYVMWGPPDEIESYLTRAQDKTAGTDPSSYPLEVWHYRYIEGIGEDVVLEFVDACKCGEYSMPMSPVRDKDVQIHAVKGLSSRPWGKLELGDPQQFVGPVNSPRIKFKSLEEKANFNLNWKQLPFEVQTDTIKATDFTSLVRTKVVFRDRDLIAAGNAGPRQTSINIFGRVMRSGELVWEIFENTVDAPSANTEPSSGAATTTFVKTLELPHGQYRIEVAAQEVNSDRWGTWVGRVEVSGQ